MPVTAVNDELSGPPDAVLQAASSKAESAAPDSFFILPPEIYKRRLLQEDGV
jgi:hypothetical protein